MMTENSIKIKKKASIKSMNIAAGGYDIPTIPATKSSPDRQTEKTINTTPKKSHKSENSSFILFFLINNRSATNIKMLDAIATA
jgi:hypothetical protein